MKLNVAVRNKSVVRIVFTLNTNSHLTEKKCNKNKIHIKYIVAIVI